MSLVDFVVETAPTDYRITTGFGNPFFREYCENMVKTAIK
jgi:hypothetical protein